MDAVKFEVKGIKCDAEGCGWRDDSVTQEQLEGWRNRPCPACGANLLTDADWEASQRLQKAAALVNAIFGNLPDQPYTHVGRVHMNGTGGVTITVPPATPEEAL